MPPQGKCKKCVKEITEKEVLLSCVTCHATYHTKCDERFFKVTGRIADTTYKQFEIMGFKWFCLECTDDRIEIVMQMKRLSEKVENIEKIITHNAYTTTYASIAKSQPERAIIVTHADKNVETKTLANKIFEGIDPVYSQIADVRIQGDKCVIKTKLDENHTEQLARSIKSRVGQGCEVKSSKPRRPRLKIVGDFIYDSDLTELNHESFIDHLKKQNQFIPKDEVITSIKEGSTKNGKSKYLIIETSPQLYKLMLQVGKVTLGFWRCKIYDANIIPRCFKCSSLGHFEKNCSSTDICCPKCSGNHRLTQCEATELKCVNCVSANKNSNQKLKTNHAAYDRNCPTSSKQTKLLQKKFNSEII